MNYFEQIHDFLEGGLEIEKESELFLALSSSEELRSQMKQLLTVGSAFKNKAGMTSPPPSSTNAVFAAVGMSSPIASAEAPAIEKKNGGKFYGKYTKGYLSGIATAIVVFWLFWTLGVPGSSAFGTKSDESSEGRETAKVLISSNMTYSNCQSAPVVPKIESVETKERVVVKYVYVEKETPEDETLPPIAANDENSDFKLNETPILTLENRDNILNAKPEFSIARGNHKFAEIPLANEAIRSVHKESNLLHDNKIGLILEMTGSEAFLQPEATISPKRTAMFNNNMITIFRPFSKNIKAGIELRQENFFQKYRGVDEYGINNTYEQQPNLTTVSATARYTFSDFGIIDPYLQAAAGVNKVGPVFRGGFGLTYSPYEDFSFILGLEYSHLNYHHDERRFSSNKIGLNYGVSVAF